MRRPYSRLLRAMRGHESRLRRWLFVIGVFALAVRSVYVLVVLSHYTPISDARHYHMIAISVAEGHGIAHPYPFGFLHPTAWRPPLYPLLLGGVYAIFGNRIGAALLLNVLLGTGVVVLAVVLAWRLFGWRAGICTGTLAAVYPPLVFNDGPPLCEPLSLLLILVTLLLLLDQRAAWAGVTAGLLVLSRTSAQFFVIVLAGWVLWRLGWRRALSFVLLLGVVCAPWAVRNWVRLGSPVLFTSSGINLVASYSPESEATDGFVDPVFDPRFAGLRDGITNEVKLDAAFVGYAMKSLRRDPSQLITDPARNLLYTFEIRPGHNDPGELADGRNLRLRHDTLPFVWLMLPVGMGGLWVLRRRPGIGPLVLTAVVFPALSVMTVAASRLRAPLDLACCIAVGGLVAELARRREQAVRSRHVVPRIEEDDGPAMVIHRDDHIVSREFS